MENELEELPELRYRVGYVSRVSGQTFFMLYQSDKAARAAIDYLRQFPHHWERIDYWGSASGRNPNANVERIFVRFANESKIK